MTARQTILDAVRRNRPRGEHKLPEIPGFAAPGDPASEFKRRLAQMGGRLLAPDGADPLAPARAMIAEAGSGIVVSRVAALPGNRALDGAAPASLHDVDLAVLQAAFAVAETGSVALRAVDLGVNALGYLAQRLLVLVETRDIVATLHDAYARPDFHEQPYVVLQTGPSATADIEGVLIHGAQGVRALSVLLLGPE